ncbi:MAG: tyrosine-type recombinase/integrase [Clostridia bacterium]|nr:tyrosine-type recombinase/integrase [Clostridia bacterium]
MLGGRKTEAGRAGEIVLVPVIRPLVKRLIVDRELPHVSDTRFREMYARALDRAGTRPHTIHECRQTTATALALAGVQSAIISAIMRHTSYAQTMDYTHVGREEKLKAITSTLHPV